MVEGRDDLTQQSRKAATNSEESYLTRTRSEVEELIVAQINRANDCLSSPVTDPDDLTQREWQYRIWDDYNLELLRRMFSDESCEREYDECLVGSGGFVGGDGPLYFWNKVHNFFNMVKVKRNCLQSIKTRLPLIPEAPSNHSQPYCEHLEPTGSKIFLVHGHDDGMKETVARFLEKLNLEVVILHERPNEGRTIIEKLEIQSRGVGFAVVLLTPDDVGRSVEDSKECPRARQNVILELGYFIGKIGRSSVAALYRKGVEFPSDYDGVMYTPVDDRGGWKLRLAREIKAAGLPVDINDAV